MATHYPHKQTIVVAVICMIAVGATAAYTYMRPAPSLTENVSAKSASTYDIVVSTSSQSDWKKQFFGQSPEALPLMAKQTSSSATENSPSTLTDQFGRELFARFIELKRNGLDTNDQLMQGSIQQTIDNTVSAVDKPKQYDANNISVTSQTDMNTYRSYGNTIGSIMINQMPRQSVVTTVNNALDRGDTALSDAIKPALAAYQKTLQALLATKVPKTMALYHLSLVNSISGLTFVSEKLLAIENDPIQSMLALGLYPKIEETMMKSLASMGDYLKKTGVTFDTGEAGSLLSAITL